MEKNEEMMEEAMRDGMRRGVFREESGPDERVDLGKQVEKTFREVYLEDTSYCQWTERQDKPRSVEPGVFQVLRTENE